MSEIYFPLQSNAHSLLTGAPVESVRRRLKSGFLFYHEVYLEAGTTEIFAGPNGSVSSSHFDERAVWQTPKSRAKAIGTAVWINIRPDGSPGPCRTVMHSPVSISWKATLLPFREEILGIDGIAFVTPPQLPTELRTVAASRARDDERNDSLKDRLPVEFVRSQVIGAANNDLVVASFCGAAVSMDRLHAKVLGSRFADQSWTPDLRALIVPFLYPQLSRASWADLASLKSMASFQQWRSIVDTLNSEIAALASNGERIEEHVVRLRYEQMVRDAQRLFQLSKTVATMMLSVIASWIADLIVPDAPPGFASPAGRALSSAAVPLAVNRMRSRKVRNWLAFEERLATL